MSSWRGALCWTVALGGWAVAGWLWATRDAEDGIASEVPASDVSARAASGGSGPSTASGRMDSKVRAPEAGSRSCSGVKEALASCEAELSMNLGREQPWPDDGPRPAAMEAAARDAVAACVDGHLFEMEVDCSEYPCIVWTMSRERLGPIAFCSEWQLTPGALSYRSGTDIGDGLEVLEFSVAAPGFPAESGTPNAVKRWDYRTDAGSEWVFDALRERLLEEERLAEEPG